MGGDGWGGERTIAAAALKAAGGFGSRRRGLVNKERGEKRLGAGQEIAKRCDSVIVRQISSRAAESVWKSARVV